MLWAVTDPPSDVQKSRKLISYHQNMYVFLSAALEKVPPLKMDPIILPRSLMSRGLEHLKLIES